MSHDREFLNKVVTSTLVLEGEGQVGEYVGGYDDWQHYVVAARTVDKPIEKEVITPPTVTRARNKLTYKEELELKTLPDKINQLESKLAALQQQMAAPEFYQQDQASVLAVTKNLTELNEELAKTYSYWEELEEKKTG